MKKIQLLARLPRLPCNRHSGGSPIEKQEKKRYYRKRVELFLLVDKIKLWTSRTGTLHGIKTVEKFGELARLTTHCGKTFTARNSRKSRGARNLRNKWFLRVCPVCGIPEWKLAKFSATRFSRHTGSTLQGGGETPDK